MLLYQRVKEEAYKMRNKKFSEIFVKDQKIFLVEETDQTVEERDILRANPDKLNFLSSNLPFKNIAVEVALTDDYHDPDNDSKLKTGYRTCYFLREHLNNPNIIQVLGYMSAGDKKQIMLIPCYINILKGSYLQQNDCPASKFKAYSNHRELSIEEINRMNLPSLVPDIMALIAMINEKNQAGEVEERFSRHRNNRPVNRGGGVTKYNVIKLRKQFREKEKKAESEEATKKALHDVRGHWRKCKSGKIVWVRSHKRGDESQGKIISAYLK